MAQGHLVATGSRAFRPYLDSCDRTPFFLFLNTLASQQLPATAPGNYFCRVVIGMVSVSAA